MSPPALLLDGERALRACQRLSRALMSSRANHSFPDLRTAAAHLRLANGSVRVDGATGLPSYETWARLRADALVAKEGGSGPRARALRELAPPRLGDLDVAERSADRHGRRLQVTLDKVSADGRLLRVRADVTVDRAVRQDALFELLFPAADLPAELLLVRVRAAQGVRDVERVSIGAVDLFVDIELLPGPAIDPPRLALGAPGAVALSLATSVCATDLSGGANDPLEEEPGPEATSVRQRLGSAQLPHRLYRDRKWVVDAVAAPLLAARARAAGTRTVFYPLEAP